MISIITPTYNSDEYIKECIESIRSQNYQDYEHIIVDGGSSDGTLEIIKKCEGTYPMRWISEKDEGMYDAISKGFKIAKGDILCWLNSDDIYMPWTLSIVNKIFQSSDVRWCCGVPAQINEAGQLYFPVTQFITFPRYCIKRGWMDGRRLGCIQQESTFWRRDLYESVGGIDKKYKFAGDYALWVKFAQKEKLYSLNTVLAGFRVHAGQKSENREIYCDEAHKLTSLELLLNKIGFYRCVNHAMKYLNSPIDVRIFLKNSTEGY